VADACDELAAIPMRGPAESLNVSVAAGIVLLNAARPRIEAAAEPKT
jgi:23S rRNA (guanosine2251-2'-O)-methyltransferase